MVPVGTLSLHLQLMLGAIVRGKGSGNKQARKQAGDQASKHSSIELRSSAHRNPTQNWPLTCGTPGSRVSTRLWIGA